MVPPVLRCVVAGCTLLSVYLELVWLKVKHDLLYDILQEGIQQRKQSTDASSPLSASFYVRVWWHMFHFTADLIVSLRSAGPCLLMGPHYHYRRFTAVGDERSAETGVRCLPVIGWWMIWEVAVGGRFLEPPHVKYSNTYISSAGHYLNNCQAGRQRCFLCSVCKSCIITTSECNATEMSAAVIIVYVINTLLAFLGLNDKLCWITVAQKVEIQMRRKRCRNLKLKNSECH